jgi:hypothetical protein
MDGTVFRTLQIPTTFPTLDEVLGVDGMVECGMRNAEWKNGGVARAFVDTIRGGVAAARGGVLTLHAEMEGRRHVAVADQLLDMLAAEGAAPCPLVQIAQDLAMSDRADIPVLEIVQRSVPGRAGTVAMARGNAECGMGNAECGMNEEHAEWGMSNR